MSVKKVHQQAYHRNGSGNGNGFVVSLFEDADGDQMVAVSFFSGQGFDSRAEAVRDFTSHTAVLSIAETDKGNIAFGRGNSWDGPEFGRQLAEAWTDKQRAEFAKDPLRGDMPVDYDPFTEFLSPEGRAKAKSEGIAVKRRQLAAAESEFAALSGRGVDLAEEIDNLQRVLAEGQYRPVGFDTIDPRDNGRNDR